MIRPPPPKPILPKPALPPIPSDGWLRPADFFKRWGIWPDSLITLWRQKILQRTSVLDGAMKWRPRYRIIRPKAFEGYVRALRTLRRTRGEE